MNTVKNYQAMQYITNTLSEAELLQQLAEESAELAQREILFKGKRMDGHGWVEGGIVPRANGQIFIAPIVNASQIIISAVDPDTVGQYTGLMDRNGKRIFEGDVVEFPNMRGNHKFRIYWSDDIASFCMKHIREQLQWTPCCNLGTVATCTVVGNIHDNPELLNSEGTTRNGGNNR